MKLFYYQRPDKLTNFGDLLNTWLWQKLLPNFFDHDPSITFIGTGTLLNHLLPQRTPKAEKLIIFSTGAGYEKKLTAIPDHWKIYCVRGFMTAQKLGLPKSMVVTDGGILIRRVFEASATKKQGFAFMPHIHHARYAGQTWQKICQEIGFSYIDPGWPVEKVLRAIAQTETLITEAMHGAIAADALRIPWIPVITSARILEFKWHDWCSSINLPFQPHYLNPTIAPYPPVAQGIRSSIKALRYWGRYYAQNWQKLQQSGASQLQHLSNTARSYLSQEQTLERLTIELEERLYQLNDDFAKN